MVGRDIVLLEFGGGDGGVVKPTEETSDSGSSNYRRLYASLGSLSSVTLHDQVTMTVTLTCLRIV